jgi:hypothetical protein
MNAGLQRCPGFRLNFKEPGTAPMHTSCPSR